MSVREELTVSLPLRLRQRRAPLVAGFAIALLIVCSVYFGAWTNPWQSIFLLVFWGAFWLLMSLALLLERHAYLELSTEGFIVHGYFGEKRVKWREVDEIYLTYLRWPWFKRITYRYAKPPSGKLGRLLTRGFDGRWRGGLGFYRDMPARDLAALMNDLRQRYG